MTNMNKALEEKFNKRFGIRGEFTLHARHSSHLCCEWNCLKHKDGWQEVKDFIDEHFVVRDWGDDLYTKSDVLDMLGDERPDVPRPKDADEWTFQWFEHTHIKSRNEFRQDIIDKLG